ncbi:MAG TPA: hypothetical protein VKQ30_20790 [Ktedonobacterales bacterium]|nr:hypothetical protein [Ktedonobacterales bacterium]
MNEFFSTTPVELGGVALLAALLVGWLYERHLKGLHEVSADSLANELVGVLNSLGSKVTYLHGAVHEVHSAVEDLHDAHMDTHEEVTGAVAGAMNAVAKTVTNLANAPVPAAPVTSPVKAAPAVEASAKPSNSK